MRSSESFPSFSADIRENQAIFMRVKLYEIPSALSGWSTTKDLGNTPMTIECIEIPMDENIGEELTRLVYEFQQEHYHKPSHFTLSPRKLLQLKAFMSEKKMFPSFTSNGDSWTWMGVPIFCGDIEGIVTGIPYELITKFEYARQKKL